MNIITEIPGMQLPCIHSKRLIISFLHSFIIVFFYGITEETSDYAGTREDFDYCSVLVGWQQENVQVVIA